MNLTEYLVEFEYRDLGVRLWIDVTDLISYESIQESTKLRIFSVKEAIAQSHERGENIFDTFQRLKQLLDGNVNAFQITLLTADDNFEFAGFVHYYNWP